MSLASGLGDRWADVVASIGALLDYYEMGNMLLSFGSAGYLRGRAAGALGGCRRALDLGAGPGQMARASGCGVRRQCVMIDVLPVASGAGGSSPLSERVRGMYEWLPFREGAFGCATASFTLRDAWNLGLTLAEIRRILRYGGGLVVLDLGKPDDGLSRAFVTAYWRVIAKMISLMTGPLARLYFKIEPTYLRLPRNSFMEGALERLVGTTTMQRLLGGGVVISIALKDR